MAKVIYLVSHSLKLYTRPDIWDNEYKQYNINSGYFEEIEKKPEYLENNVLVANTGIVQNIMKNVLHSNYGILLPEDKMNWYLNFQKESNKHPDLLKNDELLFNYLVLKAELAGMSFESAEIIYSDYVNKKKNNTEGLVCYDEIFKVFDEIIENKTYWIPNIEDEIKKESLILDDMIHSRSTSSNYKFELFEKRYLNLCNTGYIKKIMEYNKNSNNLYSKGLSLDEQKDFLLDYFTEKTEKLMTEISDNYEYFKGNFASKKAMMDNMKRTLEYAIKFW